jgi:hypothetical protein
MTLNFLASRRLAALMLLGAACALLAGCWEIDIICPNGIDSCHVVP